MINVWSIVASPVVLSITPYPTDAINWVPTSRAMNCRMDMINRIRFEYLLQHTYIFHITHIFVRNLLRVK